MIIPEQHKAEIIDGMLEMLDPEAVEATETVENIEGVDLINLHGIYKTQDGAQVLPGVVYSVSSTRYQKVNHRQKIGQIIADAATLAEAYDRLGVHLAKFAKDQQAVINSIPVHLSIKNIRQNEN